MLLTQEISQQSTSRMLRTVVLPQVLDTVMSTGIPVAGVVGGGYHADLQVPKAQEHSHNHGPRP